MPAESEGRVERLALRDFRSYERADVALADGVTVVHGPVGAGKTNLLEALYFGCVGRSCRTTNGRELIRFGASAARVSVVTSRDGYEHVLQVGLDARGQKVFQVDGTRVERPPDELRPPVCVFLPDRLELVKGAAALRRSHLDALIAALWPARADLRARYTRALSQRNALLGRLRANHSDRSQLATWNRELAITGLELMQVRSGAVEELAPDFRAWSSELGLDEAASLAYEPRSGATSVHELESELEARTATDIERGFTTHGPHRDELRLASGERDLRAFGSQGQQRLALLALLFAERDVIERVRAERPVMLLDDVSSELDEPRRRRLLGVLEAGGQALVTTADPEPLWTLGRDLDRLEVRDGRVLP